jgi:hypothetical protein
MRFSPFRRYVRSWQSGNLDAGNNRGDIFGHTSERIGVTVMGRSAIEEKLNRQLSSKAPLTETRVVYILVETRKLLELQGELSKYPALRFYCDWALHTNMDRAGAQRILRLFDRAHPVLCAGQTLPQHLDREITETTNLRLFKRDFEKFLKDYNLPKEILTARWTKFLHSYAAVIEDCPLTVKGNNLTNIKSVTLTKEEAKRKLKAGDRRFLMYRICWTCCGLDGTSGTWASYNSIP